MGRLW